MSKFMVEAQGLNHCQSPTLIDLFGHEVPEAFYQNLNLSSLSGISMEDPNSESSF